MLQLSLHVTQLYQDLDTREKELEQLRYTVQIYRYVYTCTWLRSECI